MQEGGWVVGTCPTGWKAAEVSQQMAHSRRSQQSARRVRCAWAYSDAVALVLGCELARISPGRVQAPSLHHRWWAAPACIAVFVLAGVFATGVHARCAHTTGRLKRSNGGYSVCFSIPCANTSQAASDSRCCPWTPPVPLITVAPGQSRTGEPITFPRSR